MSAPPKKMRAKSIGHYILGKTIGEGTFGKVKLGTHILTGEKVAVKILEKERIVDVADVERVAREIHILKLIQHPHVIQLYEIIETPRQLYLITEYCSGGELFDHIVASGRVKEREACRFFHQIIGGVEQIHRQNVVHRDLKPENLLLDDQKNIKIVDFGLSNTFQDGQLLKTACGSPCYAAPEMIAGQRYVPNRCDIWSCGVILFALVCGYLPFEDQNTSALYRKILNAEYQAPKFISDAVRDLVARMLTTDPEQRITIPRIRAHPWYQQISEASHCIPESEGERVLDEEALDQLDHFGFPRDYAVRCLQMNKHNHVTTTYYLLVEKKRRTSSKTGGGAQTPRQPQAAADVCGGAASPMPAAMEVDQCGDAFGMAGGFEATPAKQAFELGAMQAAANNTAADADRAGGASPAPAANNGRPPRTPEPFQYTPGAVSGVAQWAQEFLPGVDAPMSGRSETPVGRGHYGADPSRRGAASAEPQVGHVLQGFPGVSPGGPGGSGPHSARNAPSPTPRRYGEQPSSNGVPTPRKRAPVQQTNGFATPRGPVPTPPLNQPGTPTRAMTPGAVGPPSSPGVPGPRSSTPAGRRPSPGALYGEPVSARAASPNYANMPNGIPVPQRPPGSATPRSQMEARRRHYTGGSATPGPGDVGAGGARGHGRAPSPAGSHGRPELRALSAAAGGGAGGDPHYGGQGGGSSSSRGGPPSPAWSARHTGQQPSPATAYRAASASPETTLPSAGPTPSPQDMAVGGSMSARDSRDEAMRTCRGSFNVSCTSSKAPKQIMTEIQKSLTMQRVSYKQASQHLVRCQKQALRFEMEISHLDQLGSMYVVRFRRVAGEMAGYKEMCSKVLAEMKI
eukprot:TRINITY_DN24327_c0_g1_i1.p1 TRINITY_DN24327_c0_g1~~TRINITY_DN24327_c0_g1_i1.p1  ORF type:complete len:855 (-),score=194.10 TRINITY_DN24327_c0_g1_i1:279-2843(-)